MKMCAYKLTLYIRIKNSLKVIRKEIKILIEKKNIQSCLGNISSK